MDKSFQIPTREEWKLGGDTGELRYESEPPPSMLRDRSAERLEHPLQVITVEHLAWLLIAAWTLLSRFAMLGARPLSSAEAGPALLAYDFANRTSEAAAAGFHTTWPGWISLLQAGLFAAFGASDFAARIIFALFGLALVAATFATRPYLGRAGALGTGTLLAISPTAAWFSRTATGGSMAAALALISVTLMMAIEVRPSAGRTSALGVAAGLMISADPLGLVSAVILIAALAIIGLFALVRTRHAYLHLRIWLVRYGGLAVTAILLAAATCILSDAVSGVSRDDLSQAATLFWPLRTAHFGGPIRALFLPLGFYEFMITIAAIIGFFTVITLRARSRFAFFVVLWTALGLAFYLALPSRQPDQILIVILPAAMLGGFAIEYLHHSRAWGMARAALGVLTILTIYVQLLSNFVYYAPDPAEARWNRHAGLYWGDGATTIRTKSECSALLERIAPSSVTAYHEDEWPPALRWYLRDARPVASSGLATIVVDTTPANAASPGSSASDRFAYEESWSPRLTALNWKRTFEYLISEKIWGEMASRTAAVRIITEGAAPAPTLILPPDAP